MSVADLAVHCGVPDRTLRKHFRVFMAASPLKYWRQLRLAGVRGCLLDRPQNASITEVAIRFGFGHLGRFAQDYRKHFGETPSATLERNRIDGHAQRGLPRNDAPYETGGAAVWLNGSRDRPSIAVLPLQNSAIDPVCRVRAVARLCDGRLRVHSNNPCAHRCAPPCNFSGFTRLYRQRA
jgi:AraC-like DNA-binding protein